ncbi:TrmH family RNA methyltransferase [Tessaracoccus oleiagri]|uniref:tRNA G18 (Ribose-2'-O)-methylase SpoU n=1 Tax=Tessaracoccus oleiagri TaxID=686624 RepID=A0A1G9LW95_9ACTN|nr:RNA methyltransferase [Tessaracoccus oleiagri]SDL66300.1 tRNA G18 (ribose-2'-O)-methylase SpoU [Tessaracoccus oleiagri]
MALLIPMEDVADRRLEEFARLRDSQLRTRLETERGLFVAEGEKIIRRAVEAGCRPSAFLLTPRWRTTLVDVLDGFPDVPCYVGTEAMIEAVSGFHVHRGALGTFHRPAPPSWAELLATDRLVVTQGLVDHANLGSIVRIAAALGWGGLVVSETCADPLYRRSIKASMGSALQLPWRRMDDDTTDLRRIREAGFTLVATTLGDDAVPLETVPPGGRLALLLGNEGHGLPDAWQREADVRVTIPMARGVDSLNVAAAAAICAYELRPTAP